MNPASLPACLPLACAIMEPMHPLRARAWGSHLACRWHGARGPGRGHACSPSRAATLDGGASFRQRCVLARCQQQLARFSKCIRHGMPLRSGSKRVAMHRAHHQRRPWPHGHTRPERYAPLAAHNALARAGKVLDVKFLDAEVAQAAVTWGHLLASGASTPPPRAEAISALRGTRLVVIVCEAKVLIHDLSSKRTTVSLPGTRERAYSPPAGPRQHHP